MPTLMNWSFISKYVVTVKQKAVYTQGTQETHVRKTPDTDTELYEQFVFNTFTWAIYTFHMSS